MTRDFDGMLEDYERIQVIDFDKYIDMLRPYCKDEESAQKLARALKSVQKSFDDKHKKLDDLIQELQTLRNMVGDEDIDKVIQGYKIRLGED